MIIPNKGINLDATELEQPEGTYRDARNLILEENILSKELGFDEIQSNTIGADSNEVVIGIIEVEDDVVYFLQNSVTSKDEIGILESNGTYRKLLSFSSNGLGFNTDFPIKGKWVKNVYNQRIIVWTDNLNKLRYLNIDKTFDENLLTANQANKFIQVMSPEYTTHDFNNIGSYYVDIVSGGNLKSGGYIPIVRYKNSNGVTTNWRILCSPVYISATKEGNDPTLGTPNINSGKRILINLTSLDQDYKYLELGAISSINEEIIVRLTESYEISFSSLNIVLDNFDTGLSIPIEDILNSKVNYETVNDIEIIQDELLIGKLNSKFEINYQKYACDILIDYSTSLVTLDDLSSITDETHKQYFMPNEVYAFYIQLEYNDGSYSKAYHIPGRQPETGETGTSTHNSLFSSLNLGFTLKKFHTESTCDNGTADTNMGYWENGDEIYPSLDDFNSDGGVDLRGQKVRHHRFPSLNHLRSQHYSATAAFGLTQMPVLSIDVSNVIIPTELSEIVKSYRILYAKRTTRNQCVLGNSVLQPHMEIQASETKSFNENVYYASGFQFKRNGSSAADNLIRSIDGFRFHAFDLLINKPEISPLYLQQEFKLSHSGISTTSVVAAASPNYGSDLDDITDKRSGFYNRSETDGKIRTFECWADEASGNVSQSATSGSDLIKAIKKHSYIPANTIVGNINNRVGEEHLHLELVSTLNNVRNEGNADPNSDSNIYTTPPATISVDTFNSTLCQVPYNIYNKFYEQIDLIVTDSITNNSTKSITADGSTDNGVSDISGGDSRPYDYFHITTGTKHAKNFWETHLGSDGLYNGLGWLNARYYMCYNSGLIDRRYQQQGEINSYIYPTYERIDSSIFENYDITQGYKLYYSRDYSMRNEYSGALPYNPYEILNVSSPYKIHRSNNKINRLTENIVFEFGYDDEDTYEMPKDKGFIVGLNNLNNRLIIRMELSTYITTPRQKIQLTGSEATIGNNDLFDIEPEELITSDKGYVGNSSKFNSLMTEYGLIIIDSDAGKIFLLTPQGIEEISKYGLFTYFRENLNILNQYISISFSSIDYEHFTDLKHETSYGNISYKIPLSTINFNKIKEGDYLYDKTLSPQKMYKITKVIIDNNLINLFVFDGDIDTGTPVSGTSNIEIIKKLDSPIQNNGIIIAYDKENLRFLVTKKESNGISNNKKFIGFLNSNITVEDGYFYLKGNVMYTKISTVETIATMIDKSFTISYYPESKAWISWHDYIPKFYVHRRNSLLSAETKNLFLHNVQDKTGYFYNSGNLIECKLTIIHNNDFEMSKIYTNLVWNTILKNNITEVEVEETFDLLTLNNSYQTSGELTLTNYVDLNTPNNIRRIKNIWRFNKLRSTGATISLRKQLTDRYLQITFKETSDRLLYIYLIDLDYKLISNYIKINEKG